MNSSRSLSRRYGMLLRRLGNGTCGGFMAFFAAEVAAASTTRWAAASVMRAAVADMEVLLVVPVDIPLFNIFLQHFNVWAL